MRVCPRSSRRVAACSLAAVAAVALLAGCSGSVQGAPVPDSAPATAGATDSGTAAPSTTAAPKSSTPKSTSPKTAAPLSELLLTPEEFPEPFGAVVLPPQAVPMAAPDLVGVPRGATVDPSECEPPEQDYGPNGTVMAVGTDNATRATISVELTKGRCTTGRVGSANSAVPVHDCHCERRHYDSDDGNSSAVADRCRQDDVTSPALSCPPRPQPVIRRC